MEPRARNPFTPTFGIVPFMLAGRSELIDDVIGGLANRPGDPNRSTIYVGPRGSGKTVLLLDIARIAAEQGWVPVNLTAGSGMLERLVIMTRENAAHLLPAEARASITSLQLGSFGVGVEANHEEVPWWLAFSRMVAELNAQGTGLLVTIDEVDPSCEELIEFIRTYQQLVGEGRDIAMLLAGLPGKVSELLQDEHVSFVRRAWQRRLEPIGRRDVAEALAETIRANGRSISDEALELAAAATGGYAFMVQLVGYELWRQGSAEEGLSEEHARRAIEDARLRMEDSVLLPTLRALRPREVEYLRAMAQDDGPSTTSQVARRMGVSMTNASNLRRRLIEHGAIHEVRMGLVDFDMPLMREFLREDPNVWY